jgi:hypothetical protein
LLTLIYAALSIEVGISRELLFVITVGSWSRLIAVVTFLEIRCRRRCVAFVNFLWS